MTLLKQLRSRADQVTLEADKMLRINRKQGEVGQSHKQIDQLTARLGQTAYGLHKQGQSLAPELLSICSQIDALFAQIHQAEQEIERIRLETLPVDTVTDGVNCVVCQAIIPSAALFCPHCGSAQPKPPPMVLCKSCGNSIPAEARFCAHCGQPVVSSTPPVADLLTMASSEAAPMTDAGLDRPAEETVEYASELPEVDQLLDVGSGDTELIAEPLPELSVLAEGPEPPVADAVVETATLICSNCQSEIPVESAFCPLCGTPTRQS